MVYISSYSAIICYLKKPIWSIREDKEAFDLYINLLKESIMVAESQWFDLKDKFDDYLSTTLNAPFDSYCSLYHDLLNSEMNEYEAILGDILNLCLELNLNTPYIVNVYSSIKSNFTIK